MSDTTKVPVRLPGASFEEIVAVAEEHVGNECNCIILIVDPDGTEQWQYSNSPSDRQMTDMLKRALRGNQDDVDEDDE
jgi:hypothetical protein